MKKVCILMMLVAMLSISTTAFASSTNVGDCMTKFSNDMRSASADYGRCALGALASSGLLACWITQQPNCDDELANFASREATCAINFLRAIISAAKAKDNCLAKAKDIDPNELLIWMEVQDIDIYINVEGLIEEIESMIESMTGRVVFGEFFEYLKVEDFKGAATYLEEVSGVDPSLAFPDQWNEMIEAAETAGLADYYANVVQY